MMESFLRKISKDRFDKEKSKHICDEMNSCNKDPFVAFLKHVLKDIRKYNGQSITNDYDKLCIDDNSVHVFLAKEKLEASKRNSQYENSFNHLISNTQKHSKSEKTSHEMAELEGNPLSPSFSLDVEDSIFVDEKMFIENYNVDTGAERSLYVPLSVTESRMVLNKFNMTLMDNDYSSGSAWLMCNELNPSKTIVLGSYIEFLNLMDKLLWEITFVKVNYPGRLSINTNYVLEDLRKSHIKIAGAPKGKMISRVVAKYNFTGLRRIFNPSCRGQMSLSNKHGNLSGFNEITASFCWHNPKRLLETPPRITLGITNDGSKEYAILNSKIFSCDESTASYVMFMELNTLKGFASGLYGKEIYWQNSSKDTVTKQLEELMEKLKNHGPKVLLCQI